MRSLLAAIDVSDVCGVVGLFAVERGVALWSPPAAWVIGGSVLIAFAVAPMFLRKGRR